jgi:hypothetical protein
LKNSLQEFLSWICSSDKMPVDVTFFQIEQILYWHLALVGLKWSEVFGTIFLVGGCFWSSRVFNIYISKIRKDMIMCNNCINCWHSWWLAKYYILC